MSEQVPLDSLPMETYKVARQEGLGAGDSISVAELRKKEAEQPTGEEETLKEYKEKREQQEDRPKIKGGFQARIDRLIKQQASTEERAAAAEKKAAELEARLNGNSRESSAVEDRADSQETREETPASRGADDPRAIAARERFADFDKVMRSGAHIRIADEAAEELHTSPLAAHVSYFIARNPELASELAKLPAAHQVQEIRRIENAIVDNEPGAGALVDRIVGESSPEEIEALKAASKGNPHLLRAVSHNLQELADLSNAVQVYGALARDPALSRHIAMLPKSKAAVALGRISASLERDSEAEEKTRTRPPAPIRPVIGGSTRSTVDLDKASYQDFKRMRQNGRVR